jgi:hypothetical protein
MVNNNNTAKYTGKSPEASGFFFSFSGCFLSRSTSSMSFIMYLKEEAQHSKINPKMRGK